MNSDRMKDEIVRWLTDENISFEEKADPNAIFNLGVQISELTVHVISNTRTHVVIICRMAHLPRLTREMKHDLDYLFTLLPVQYKFFEDSFQVSRVIYQEALTKQTLMDAVLMVTKAGNFGARRIRARQEAHD